MILGPVDIVWGQAKIIEVWNASGEAPRMKGFTSEKVKFVVICRGQDPGCSVRNGLID